MASADTRMQVQQYIIGSPNFISILQYLVSAEQPLYERITFYLVMHLGPVSLTVGIVTLLLAVLGIAAGDRKSYGKTLIQVSALLLFILLIFEVFVAIVIGLYFSMSTRNVTLRDLLNDNTERWSQENIIVMAVLGLLTVMTLVMSISSIALLASA